MRRNWRAGLLAAVIDWLRRLGGRPQARECPMCGRTVSPGDVCQDTVCPWELTGDERGPVRLARPLRQRIK
jgi:hypothetical protein